VRLSSPPVRHPARLLPPGRQRSQHPDQERSGRGAERGCTSASVDKHQAGRSRDGRRGLQPLRTAAYGFNGTGTFKEDGACGPLQRRDIYAKQEPGVTVDGPRHREDCGLKSPGASPTGAARERHRDIALRILRGRRDRSGKDIKREKLSVDRIE